MLLPQEFGATTAAQAWDLCISNLEKADVVVACANGADVDSGTAFECGYACAKEKPVIVWRDDWRKADDLDAPINCMLYKGEGMKYVSYVPPEGGDVMLGALAKLIHLAILETRESI